MIIINLRDKFNNINIGKKLAITLLVLFPTVTMANNMWQETPGEFIPWDGEPSGASAWGQPVWVANEVGKDTWLYDLSSAITNGWENYISWSFTPDGLFKSLPQGTCAEATGSDGYIAMDYCSANTVEQKFKYRIDDHKVESIAYPGYCITFGYTTLYWGMAYGSPFLTDCVSNSSYTLWGYGFAGIPGAGTGAQEANGLKVTDLPEISVNGRVFANDSAFFAYIPDYRYAHFTVPQTSNSAIDCNKIVNPQSPITQEQCLAMEVKPTCNDYNQAWSTAAHKEGAYTNKFLNIKEWWNEKDNYLKGADIIINGSWFGVNSTDFRSSPIPYSEVCSDVYGLYSSDGGNMSVTNTALDRNGGALGQLDAIMFSMSKGEHTPAYVEKITLIRRNEMQYFIPEKKAFLDRHVNALSGVILAENGVKETEINSLASPDLDVARTVIAITNKRELLIFVIQNSKKSKHTGINLYSLRDYIMQTYPNVMDIIALDGSGSSQFAVRADANVDPGFSTWNCFEDNNGERVCTSLPADLIGKERKLRPVPAVLMIDAVR